MYNIASLQDFDWIAVAPGSIDYKLIADIATLGPFSDQSVDPPLLYFSARVTLEELESLLGCPVKANPSKRKTGYSYRV